MAKELPLPTPEGEEMVVPARTGHRFIFQDKMDKGWLDWKSEIKLAGL